MKTTSEILERISKNSKEHKDGVYTRLYRYLLREDIYYLAYQKLYSNRGAGTKGVDGDTADGFGKEYIQRLIDELKNFKYEPKPIRRTHIPKANGKKRPLGIPTFRDKLVQEAIRLFLEAIYEPNFSNNSHGFRPNKSCHTALMEIKRNFTGVKWFIEGDITGCFDNINHKKLIEIISRKIKDSKFVGLIIKFLKAGHVENWKYNVTYSGTPQGGIISPILANIYLNELDEKILEIKERFDKPHKRVFSEEYRIRRNRVIQLQKLTNKHPNDTELKNWVTEIKELKKSMLKFPASIPLSKRIVYTRYADDFLIGVCGNKQECLEIEEQLGKFLNNELKLELSKEKTKITHSSNHVRFFGI